jgi:broad specificity phosphatase PhoE
MLRVILVVAPKPEQVALVAGALEGTPLTSLYASPAVEDAARQIARPHALQVDADARFEGGERALAVISRLAETVEGTIAVVTSAEVVRAVLLHALDAPVPQDRLALDEGAVAEVEVRTDAPWTVNRINDACHLVG